MITRAARLLTTPLVHFVECSLSSHPSSDLKLNALRHEIFVLRNQLVQANAELKDLRERVVAKPNLFSNHTLWDAVSFPFG